ILPPHMAGGSPASAGASFGTAPGRVDAPAVNLSEWPSRQGPVAQGIEQWFPKPCVGGSNPPRAAFPSRRPGRNERPSHVVRVCGGAQHTWLLSNSPARTSLRLSLIHI